MSIINSYYFTISMSLSVGAKSYDIVDSSIRTIILDYNYDKMNMPVMYMKLRISANLYNIMVLNSNTAILSVRLFKSDDGSSSISEPYIEDKFTYIMTTDPNYNESIERFTNSAYDNIEHTPESYMEGFIGLTSLHCINDNKKLFNDILKNTNLISIIHKYTHHMNMVIEPLENNVHIGQFIIPPITSITNLIAYIDKNYYLYKSGYRFFRDFEKTYLLSAKGNAVPDNYSTFNTVIISIVDPINDLSKINSMELDRQNHAYIIYVDANDTSLNVDRVTDKQYNYIIGVDTLGRTARKDITLPTYPESTKKAILERTSVNNLDAIYNSKSTTESLSVILTINKAEIDSTILSPNKEYLVRNYESSSQYDGRYILSYKKEIIYRRGETMIGNVMFGLRKV